MKYYFFAFIAAVILIYPFTGCKKETKCIDGNGDIVQEQRDLDDFNRVAVTGAFMTTIYQSQNNTVDFFAESNIIPLIRTDVSNQQLRIIVQEGSCYNTNNAVEVYVNSPDYEEISMNGSGDVSANNLTLDKLKFTLGGSGNLNSIIDLDELDLSITGSGNANIVGNGQVGDYRLTGSGNLYGTNFNQDTVYIVVSGSGDAYINVSQFLDVTITGSGSVYYKGNPSDINQSITGSGQLIDQG